MSDVCGTRECIKSQTTIHTIICQIFIGCLGVLAMVLNFENIMEQRDNSLTEGVMCLGSKRQRIKGADYSAEYYITMFHINTRRQRILSRDR